MPYSNKYVHIYLILLLPFEKAFFTKAFKWPRYFFSLFFFNTAIKQKQQSYEIIKQQSFFSFHKLKKSFFSKYILYKQKKKQCIYFPPFFTCYLYSLHGYSLKREEENDREKSKNSKSFLVQILMLTRALFRIFISNTFYFVNITCALSSFLSSFFQFIFLFLKRVAATLAK